MSDSNADQDREKVFDRLFRQNDDPWNFEASDYERAKRKAATAAVGNRRYAKALEIGCANGVLTCELAQIADTVLAIDVSSVALDLARGRLAGNAGVTLQLMEVPRQWPAETFDLIVLSEVLYFLTSDEVERCSALASSSLRRGGVCLLVNWTGENDLALSGNEAANLFQQSGHWKSQAHIGAEKYRLDVLAL